MDKVLNTIPFSYDYDSHKLVKRTPDWAGVGRGLAIGGAGSSLASTLHSRAHAYARTHRPGAADQEQMSMDRGMVNTHTRTRTHTHCARTAGEMPAKFLAASPAVQKVRCNRGFPPFTPPFHGMGYPPRVGEILRKICAKNLAQGLRQELLRKICDKNSCAKFATRILAPNLRQEFLSQICARNPAQPGRVPPPMYRSVIGVSPM